MLGVQYSHFTSDTMKIIILLLCVYGTYGQEEWQKCESWQNESSTVNIYKGYPIQNMTANFKLIMDRLDELQELVEKCPCKENFMDKPSDFTQSGCATSSPTSFFTGILDLDASHAGSWPANGFCRVYAKKSLGQIDYRISVDLFNVDSNKGIEQGFLGIFYNAKDINNFDYVYIRVHSASRCHQTGQVINGQVNWIGEKVGECRNGIPQVGKWFNMEVIVKHNSAEVYRDGVLILTVVSHFPARASGGTLVANGYHNVGRFRNFKITY